MNQENWNILFSWLTGNKCMLPEGCSPPPVGIVFYALFFITLGLVSATVIKREDQIREKVEEWRR